MFFQYALMLRVFSQNQCIFCITVACTRVIDISWNTKNENSLVNVLYRNCILYNGKCVIYCESVLILYLKFLFA